MFQRSGHHSLFVLMTDVNDVNASRQVVISRASRWTCAGPFISPAGITAMKTSFYLMMFAGNYSRDRGNCFLSFAQQYHIS
jgi:hypothetical protein